MKLELTGMTHLFDPDSAHVHFGKVHMVLDDRDTPMAEMHVSDEESGATRVFMYTDEKQIDVLVDLFRAIHTTHTWFEVPVVVG